MKVKGFPVFPEMLKGEGEMYFELYKRLKKPVKKKDSLLKTHI